VCRVSWSVVGWVLGGGMGLGCCGDGGWWLVWWLVWWGCGSVGRRLKVVLSGCAPGVGWVCTGFD
jgi:hypothetical protein